MRKVILVAVAALALGGCAKTSVSAGSNSTTVVTLPGSSSTAGASSQTSTAATTATPNPTGAAKVFAMGATGHITEGGQDVCDLIVSSPQITTTPASDGTAPANGYFATFTVQATDVSKSQTYDLNSADFYVQGASSGAHYDETAGNGIDDEGDNELPLTTMNPGQVVTGTITIDEPYQHGWLVYAPDDQALGAWTF